MFQNCDLVQNQFSIQINKKHFLESLAQSVECLTLDLGVVGVDYLKITS